LNEKNILQILNQRDAINPFEEVQTLEQMFWKAISDSRLPASSSSIFLKKVSQPRQEKDFLLTKNQKFVLST
jgi:hypothetical protein